MVLMKTSITWHHITTHRFQINRQSDKKTFDKDPELSNRNWIETNTFFPKETQKLKKVIKIHFTPQVMKNIQDQSEALQFQNFDDNSHILFSQQNTSIDSKASQLFYNPCSNGNYLYVPNRTLRF